MHVTGEEVRKVRQQLGEDQTAFGARFGKTRRTIIRWEKGGAEFTSWRRYYGDSRSESEAERWSALAKLAADKAAKNSTRKSTTALATRKSKAARRRQSASHRKSARKSPARNRASRRKARKSKRVKR